MARRLSHLAKWWHLLSLDAPTVAALWACFFARAMHLRLPWLGAAMLALGTWLLYVADRLLDGLPRDAGGRLRERHRFYARHRAAFVSLLLLLSILLAWFVATRMRREALHDDCYLGVLAALYLLAVHGRRRAAVTAWPKELAVAILFAAATAVPAWSRLGRALSREQLAPAVAIFALLCWTNCVSIEKWEAGHPDNRWASLHLRGIVTMMILFMPGAVLLAPSRGLMAVYLAALLSSGLLLGLDARRTRISSLHLRIAADAALLTPLAFFPLAR